jgi:hypothetical protein
MMREKTQISNIRNKKREVTTNTKEIHGTIRDYFEKLYFNKLENLEEMDSFLDTCDHPKLNQVDINHLNRSITCTEIEAAIKSLPKEKSSGPEFYQTFKEELIPTLLKHFHKIEWKEHYLTHSMKPVLHSSQNQTRTHPKNENYRPISLMNINAKNPQ